MQNLRSVFAKVYRGGRSMGSPHARNFSSPPGISNESSIVWWLIVRGIGASVGYITGPYLFDDSASELEKHNNELLRDCEEYLERTEKLWSDRVGRHNLMAGRKRQ
ncbi:unnamed protein product [Arabidopsis lyrata]|uniref:uncharacterized protein LOC9318334 n=1 Tax=Arabidopsis lyrata subsp. lyrata TaxID=81972 RepID=UPI000A29D2DD|nr:uncharacterized protein LOC9318334 [Arabidopsis lyrata subsp. lyrata]CAH8259106.1 unnamed protein product [Arabidopsis lyrata]|eukprot:XP_020889458.1 uncharacterized protein LOC9318334 [Arabidopsis lyrata subsp. lyrata]